MPDRSNHPLNKTRKSVLVRLAGKACQWVLFLGSTLPVAYSQEVPLSGGGERGTRLESFRSRCMTLAESEPGTSKTGPGTVGNDIARLWESYPDEYMERDLIQLVVDLRLGGAATQSRLRVLRSLMQALANLGEEPFISFAEDVFRNEGLTTLINITMDTTKIAHMGGLTPEQKRLLFVEYTRVAHQNVLFRKKIRRLAAPSGSRGLTIADPLTKRVVHFDAAAATEFMQGISETRFCRINSELRLSALLQGVGASVADSLAPRCGFTFCPYGQVDAGEVILLWFDYPGYASFTSEATCLDRVSLVLADGTARQLPVRSSLKKALRRGGLAARKPGDLAWWLSLGSGGMKATIHGKDVVLFSWENIAKRIQPLLSPQGSSGTGATKIEAIDFGEDELNDGSTPNTP